MTRGETVDVELSAVRSGGGTGQGLQIGEQFVGIVGQSFQFLAGDGDGSGVVRGIDIDGRGGIGDLNFLLLDFDGHGNVEAQRLIGGDDYVVVFVNRKSRSDYGERVLACGQPFEFIEALSVGLRSDRRGGNGGRRHDDVGVGDGGAGWVGYLTAQNAGGCRRCGGLRAALRSFGMQQSSRITAAITKRYSAKQKHVRTFIPSFHSTKSFDMNL